jgi:vacuolar-type H+-ATPase subunit F/Vma7
MAAPVLIGDRLTAVGFRLAGVRSLVVDPADAGTAFREALARRDGPILITAALAAQVPPAVLDKAIRKADPPVAVIPDVAGAAEPADMADKVRRALGVEA